MWTDSVFPLVLAEMGGCGRKSKKNDRQMGCLVFSLTGYMNVPGGYCGNVFFDAFLIKVKEISRIPQKRVADL